MTIRMLVWCIWLSVCVSGSESSPFSCRWFGFAGWHWQPIMVHRVRVSRTLPSGREVLRAVAQWVAQGHTCGHRLADAACCRQSGARGAQRRCSMFLTCELSWFVVTNPHVRVRRSSAANWGGMVMQEGRGVLASGVLAAGYCCHCRVGWEGMKGPGLFMWCTCCGEDIVLVIWGAGVWEETFRMSDLIWCSPEEWQVTETALSGTWSFISRCLLDAAVIWSIGCWVYIYIYIYAFSRRFYPKRLTLHSSYSFYILSALAFPGNRTHDLGVASAMLYQLSYRKAS